MKHLTYYLLALCSTLALNCSHGLHTEESTRPIFPQEIHFRSLRQLTFGGLNTKPQWSFNQQWLTFQHHGPGILKDSPKCNQTYLIRNDGSETRKISNGIGQTNDSTFLTQDSRIVFSSTFAVEKNCPQPPTVFHEVPIRFGATFSVPHTYQIYGALPEGVDPITLEPGAPRSYHAGTAVCHDGSVVFVSDRGGTFNLFHAKLSRQGSFEQITQITDSTGYKGHVSFSPDCRQITWDAYHPSPGKELDEFQSLHTKHLFKPTQSEIWLASSDGTLARQITKLNAFSFAPTFTPDGRRILFSSTFRNKEHNGSGIFLIHVDGTNLEPISHSSGFDAFPAFSKDGRFLAFSSSRFAQNPTDLNLFIAEWQEAPKK
jgi:Tol biopolymer transport system component